MAGKKSTSKDNTPIASQEEFEKLIIDNQNFAYRIWKVFMGCSS